MNSCVFYFCKLETNIKHAKRILQKHRLEKIIKLPADIFSGVTTSIFIFRASVPQGNNEIFACYIKDDGFETVKNQGRHDIKNKWAEIEKYWIEVIKKQTGDTSIQWLNPEKNISYKMPETPFQISEQDFKKTVLDYILFENNINEQDFKKNILDYILYQSQIIKRGNKIVIQDIKDK